MFGSLGITEILFILVLALLVFGPRKLPEIGRTLGRALGEFRRATSELKHSLDAEISREETPSTPAAAPQPPSSQPPASPPPAAQPAAPHAVAPQSPASQPPASSGTDASAESPDESESS